MKIKYSICISICIIVTAFAMAVVTYISSQGSCPRGTFACDGGRKCVLQREICDQRRDCADGQDEDPLECGHYHGSIDFTVSLLGQSNRQPVIHPPADTCSLAIYPERCICKQSTVLICKRSNLTEFPAVSAQVTSIYLRDNRLTLTNSSLAGLDITHILNLKHNRIAELPSRLLLHQKRLRKLFLDHNYLAAIPVGIFQHLTSLEWLMLGDNRLSAFPLSELRELRQLKTLNLSANSLSLEREAGVASGDNVFPPMPSIMEIYLEHNKVREIRSGLFGALDHLQFLSLSNNRINFIANDAFDGLLDLRELKLSNNYIAYLDPELFVYTTKLDALFIGFNDIEIYANTLESTNVSLLNLDGIKFDRIDFGAIRGIANLQAVVFDSFYYCSQLPSIRKCKPRTDGVSSLTDLLAKPVLRYSAWTMATLSLVGNTLVMWRRLSCADDNRAVRLVIVNLSMADWLMGAYLGVIALQDHRYRSGYQMAAADWTGSWLCTAIGVLAMLSGEVSLLIMAFMSVERFMLIADPFRKGRARIDCGKVAQVLVAIWVVGATMAGLPVIQWRSSTRYYGTNSGVCFPLHLQDPFAVGWQYSAVVMLGVNLCLLLVIAALYTALLVSVWRTRKATEVSKFDCEFAIRFFFIVFTNAACWAPIMAAKVSVLAGGGEISADFYAWLMVFVLPLNSAINPLLYTFTTPKYRTQVMKHGWNKFPGTRRLELHTTDGSVTTNPDDSQGRIVPRLGSIGQQTMAKWKW